MEVVGDPGMAKTGTKGIMDGNDTRPFDIRTVGFLLNRPTSNSRDLSQMCSKALSRGSLSDWPTGVRSDMIKTILYLSVGLEAGRMIIVRPTRTCTTLRDSTALSGTEILLSI